MATNIAFLLEIFQSTLPVRGATEENKRRMALYQFQSTLPVRGATRYNLIRRAYWVFQSTLPVRGATLTNFLCMQSDTISIHAPREGSDFFAANPLGVMS